MPKNLSLELYHSTWAMERRHPDLDEWSLEQQCEMLVEAGFHGVNIDPDTPYVPKLAQCRNVLHSFGLQNSLCAFPANLDDLKASLDQCVNMDSTALVVNARIFPNHASESRDFVERSLDLGLQAGIPVFFETHRFTLTNDLLFTCLLLDEIPRLQLVADLSHYVVGREIPHPVDLFHQNLIEKILSRSVSIQGRVASREQIQVPLHFPMHQKWVATFYNWWRLGIRSWIDKAKSGDRFNFTCELGPPEYAMTDESGYEMSDRWRESLLLKKQIENIWQQEYSS